MSWVVGYQVIHSSISTARFICLSQSRGRRRQGPPLPSLCLAAGGNAKLRRSLRLCLAAGGDAKLRRSLRLSLAAGGGGAKPVARGLATGGGASPLTVVGHLLFSAALRRQVADDNAFSPAAPTAPSLSLSRWPVAITGTSPTFRVH